MIDLTSQHDGQEPAAGANLQTGKRQDTARIVVPRTSLAGARPPTAKTARVQAGSEVKTKNGGGSRGLLASQRSMMSSDT